MLIVGLPDASVKESRERVTAAISSSGFIMNDGVTTVNLAPADLKKEGPGFDLPIAISLVAHRSRIPIPVLSETAMIGELALNGELRPVRGLLAIALEARARGRKRLLVPKRAAARGQRRRRHRHHRRRQSARGRGLPEKRHRNRSLSPAAPPNSSPPPRTTTSTSAT
jgi:predicted ATPase with chaperone activity